MVTTLGDGPLADRTGARTAVLMVKYAAPAGVLEASVEDLEPVEKVASAYADAGKTFPVHTPSAAWASAAHYHATLSTDTKVGNRIKAALDQHRLFGEWSRLEQNRPVPAESRHYGLPDSKKYPLDTAEQVKAAADYFTKYSDQFTPTDLQTFSRNVLSAGERVPGALSNAVVDQIEAAAGLGRLASTWKEAFDQRIWHATRDKLPALVEVLKEASASPPTDPVLAATHLRAVDRVNNWQLPDPLTQLCDETPSAARRKLAAMVRAADGSWYKRADLNKIPDETLSNLFDLPAVVSNTARCSLLQEKCAAFREVLDHHGVSPVEVPRDPRVDWAALARS